MSRDRETWPTCEPPIAGSVSYSIAHMALQCQYGRSDAFNRKRSLRLATEVVNRSEKLSEVLATKGHTFEFFHDEGVDPHAKVNTRPRTRELSHPVLEDSMNRMGRAIRAKYCGSELMHLL